MFEVSFFVMSSTGYPDCNVQLDIISLTDKLFPIVKFESVNTLSKVEYKSIGTAIDSLQNKFNNLLYVNVYLKNMNPSIYMTRKIFIPSRTIVKTLQYI